MSGRPAKQARKVAREANPLASALKHLDDNYKHSVLAPPEVVDLVPTGIAMIDHLCGGGLPAGRICMLWGKEHAGKTTLALSILAGLRARGFGRCAYIDMEHAVSGDYAEALGAPFVGPRQDPLRSDRVLFSRPSSAEEALDVAGTLASVKGVGCVVIDSVASLVPQRELDGNMDDTTVGLQARLLSQFCRRFTGQVSKSGGIVLLLNQEREKVGVNYGDPTVIPGGRALKFYTSVILQVWRTGKSTSRATVWPNFFETTVKVVKNKVAPNKYGQRGSVPIWEGRGVDRSLSLLDVAVELGIVTQKSAHYRWGEHKLGQGLDAAREWVGVPANYEALAAEVYASIAEANKLGGAMGAADEVEAEGEEAGPDTLDEDLAL